MIIISYKNVTEIIIHIVSGVRCQENTEASTQQTDDSSQKQIGFFPKSFVCWHLKPDTGIVEKEDW